VGEERNCAVTLSQARIQVNKIIYISNERAGKLLIQPPNAQSKTKKSLQVRHHVCAVLCPLISRDFHGFPAQFFGGNFGVD
jgi:hypothetical protein